MKLHVELSRFRVKEGKSAVVDQWMAFLNEHMEDTLLTLEGEKMYVETIFREVLDGHEYLYWYSVQAEGEIKVEDSESYIGKKTFRILGRMHRPELWYGRFGSASYHDSQACL